MVEVRGLKYPVAEAANVPNRGARNEAFATAR